MSTEKAACHVIQKRHIGFSAHFKSNFTHVCGQLLSVISDVNDKKMLKKNNNKN